jgi:hypothetical protein
MKMTGVASPLSSNRRLRPIPESPSMWTSEMMQQQGSVDPTDKNSSAEP